MMIGARSFTGSIVAKPSQSTSGTVLRVSSWPHRLRTASNYYVAELVAVQPPEPLATYPTEMATCRQEFRCEASSGASGQTICRNGSTITVDGIEIGEARERDSRGRTLPVWEGCDIVEDGKLFLMNWQAADSFDGRYFGMTPATAVIGRVLPVWTWED
jgi:type IV secretory pathway protease TraF